MNNRTCALEGCENGLEGKRDVARYCCKQHYYEANKNTPEYNVYQESRKPYKKAYRESLEGKAMTKAYRESSNGRASLKAYRESSKGRAMAKAYYEANKDKKKAYDKIYRQSPEYKVRQQTPEYKARRTEGNNKRLALKHTVLATYTPEDWKRTLEYFDNRCAYCLEPFGNETPQQDHFIPLDKLGSYTPDNIVCACQSCNSSKRDNDPEVWCTPEQYLKVVTYFMEVL